MGAPLSSGHPPSGMSLQGVASGALPSVVGRTDPRVAQARRDEEQGDRPLQAAHGTGLCAVRGASMSCVPSTKGWCETRSVDVRHGKVRCSVFPGGKRSVSTYFMKMTFLADIEPVEVRIRPEHHLPLGVERHHDGAHLATPRDEGEHKGAIGETARPSVASSTSGGRHRRFRRTASRRRAFPPTHADEPGPRSRGSPLHG